MRSQQSPGPPTAHLFRSGCSWNCTFNLCDGLLSRIPATPSGYTGTPHCRRQSRAGPVPNPGGDNILLSNFVLLQREGSRLSARRASSICLHLGRNKADGAGLFPVHVCNVCRADLWFLLNVYIDGYVFSVSTDAPRRCSPTMPRDWKMLMSPCCASGRSLQCPQVFVSGLRKLKSDGTGQCLWLMLLLTDHTEMCSFHITSLGWSQMLAKINDGDACLFSIFFQSQGKPASTVVPPC